MKNKSLLLLVLVGLICWLPPLSAAADQKKVITPILSLLLGQSKTLQFIVYHRYVGSNRDLYVVREDGTARTALATSPTEHEYYAGISKSNRIIFVRGVNWKDKMGIYSINPDGTDFNKIIDSAEYESYWGTASNGRIIFFRYDGNAGACADYDLYSINPNGTGLVTLYNTPENDHYLASTKDNRIIFGTRRPGCGNVNLYSIKADGTGIVTIGATDDNHYFLTLTSDNRVIFSLQGVNTTYIRSSKTDGSDPRGIASGYYKAITKDNRVIVSIYNRDKNLGWLNIVDADGRNYQSLTPNGVDGGIGDVIVSSTGKIVFTSQWGTFSQRLWIVNVDGTGLQYLDGYGGTIKPFYLTGTNRLIYEIMNYNLNPPVHNIKSILLNDTEEKYLANSLDIEKCESITSDGRLIFSRYGGGSNWNLYSINPDGTKIATIADSSDDEYFMGVTSNNRVIFSRRGDMWGNPRYSEENVDLYSVKSDGTSKTRIAGSVDSESFAAIY